MKRWLDSGDPLRGETGPSVRRTMLLGAILTLIALAVELIR